MKSIYANQLEKPQIAVDSVFAVTDIEYKDYSGGKHLLKLNLKDCTGSVPAVMWDVSDKMQLELKAGTVSRVKGRTESGRYGFQVVLSALEPVTEGQFDPEDFIQTSKRPLNEMEEEIRQAVGNITSNDLKKFLTSWLLETGFLKQYMSASAATKIHHAYRGGLAEHSLETLKIGMLLVSMYPKADRDIVTAGCLLHDIGKIRDYSVGLTLEMTDAGKLMGHILNGFAMLKEQSAKYGLHDSPWMKHLEHIIASHHADQDDRTPVQPMTLEAMIVHLSDLASGRLTQLMNILESGKPANSETWSNYDKYLNRALYKGFNTGTDPEDA